MWPRSALVHLAAAAAFFACVSGGVSGQPRTTSEIITRAEIESAEVRTLYDVILRLRPRWLNVRGAPRSFELETEVVVFQDESYLGGVDILRRLGPEGITSIRYVDGPTASATLPGMSHRHVSHAIVISMRAPGP